MSQSETRRGVSIWDTSDRQRGSRKGTATPPTFQDCNPAHFSGLQPRPLFRTATPPTFQDCNPAHFSNRVIHCSAMTTTIKNPKRIPFTLQDQCDHTVAVRDGKLPTQPLTDAVYDWAVRKFAVRSSSYTVTNREVAKQRGEFVVTAGKFDRDLRVSGDKLVVRTESLDGSTAVEWFQLPKQD